jgi:hypothetical protein
MASNKWGCWTTGSASRACKGMLCCRTTYWAIALASMCVNSRSQLCAASKEPAVCTCPPAPSTPRCTMPLQHIDGLSCCHCVTCMHAMSGPHLTHSQSVNTNMSGPTQDHYVSTHHHKGTCSDMRKSQHVCQSMRTGNSGPLRIHTTSPVLFHFNTSMHSCAA